MLCTDHIGVIANLLPVSMIDVRQKLRNLAGRDGGYIQTDSE